MSKSSLHLALQFSIGLIQLRSSAMACFLPRNSVTVHLNMSEWDNGQLPLAKRTGRSKISPDIWEQIRTAYASGIGLREIARNMGISEGTVLARAKREGWTRQIQSAKALTKREDAPPAVTPVQAVAMSMRQRGERHVERMAGLSEKVVTHVEALEPDIILEKIDKVEKADRVARRTFGLEDNPYGEHFTLNVLNLNMLVEDQEQS